MSLEYSMFSFEGNYPTADSMSDLIMQVAMNEYGDDLEGEILKRLVDAAWYLRRTEAIAESDEDEVDIPSVHEPAAMYMDLYAKACKAMGEPCSDGDAWWEDWWPQKCLWHRSDIARLARLKAGESRSIRRQLCAEFAKHTHNKGDE